MSSTVLADKVTFVDIFAEIEPKSKRADNFSIT